MSHKLRLGVNIDHIATIRQARRTPYPDMCEAAQESIDGGADQITIHLREDRRHIQDQDAVDIIQRFSKIVPINLEMAMTTEMIRFAEKHKPQWVCLVPERREELTTEGGLDVKTHASQFIEVTKTLTRAGIKVSPFINADQHAVDLCAKAGAGAIEFHTGTYAHHPDDKGELERLHRACLHAHAQGLGVHAGHGLTIENVGPIARLPHMAELNIGHAIVARALFIGLKASVIEMKAAMLRA